MTASISGSRSTSSRSRRHPSCSTCSRTTSSIRSRPGWRRSRRAGTPFRQAPGDVNLDYVRGNLFDPALMRALPPMPPGPTTISPTCSTPTSRGRSAIPPQTCTHSASAGARRTAIPDKVFGFEPGDGVHDIHMNQGNDPTFARDDGVWQDGGLLVHFPAVSRWVGDLPRVPEPGVAHRRRDRPRDRGGSSAASAPPAPRRPRRIDDRDAHRRRDGEPRRAGARARVRAAYECLARARST